MIAERLSRSIINMEFTQNPEKLKGARPDVVIVCGEAGTGKTTLLKALSKMWGDMPIISARTLLESKTGKKVEESVERGTNVDKDIDAEMTRRVLGTATEGPALFDFRKGAWNVRGNIKEEARKKGIVIATVLVTAGQDARYRRIFVREEKKNPPLTYKQLETREHNRELTDKIAWEKADPTLKGKALFDPTLTDENGQLIYDIWIDTTWRSPDEGAIKTRYKAENKAREARGEKLLNDIGEVPVIQGRGNMPKKSPIPVVVSKTST